MKVNSELNRLAAILAVIYTGLSVLSLLVKNHTVAMAPGDYQNLTFAIKTMYFLLTIYLVMALRAANEKQPVVLAFIMYTCIEASYLADKAFPALKGNNSYAVALGSFTILVSIFVFIQAFRIQNRFLGLPYRLFIFSLVIVVIVTITLALTFRSVPYRLVNQYLELITLLTPLSILFIIKRAADFIKDRDEQSTGALPY